MIILIDNYDSFVQNLARHVRLCDEKTIVIRNDEMSIEHISALSPTAIILSPGPCTPKQAGICTPLVRELGARIPILGVCLGHQVISEAYGGETLRGAPTHGRASAITHDSSGLFRDIPSPMQGGRYHALITDITNAANLKATAHSDDGTIMALAHKTHPVYGVQFHPESILTENGLTLLQNFVKIAHDFHKKRAS